MLIISLYPDLHISVKPIMTAAIVVLCDVIRLEIDEALHERLVSYPDSSNPNQMITSGLIHVDWPLGAFR